MQNQKKKVLEETYKRFAEEYPTDFFIKTNKEKITFWDVISYCNKKRRGRILPISEFFLMGSFLLDIQNNIRGSKKNLDCLNLALMQIIPSQVMKGYLIKYDYGKSIKGEQRSEKCKKKSKIKSVFTVIKVFSNQIRDALADNFDSRHKLAKSLVEEGSIFDYKTVCSQVINNDVFQV